MFREESIWIKNALQKVEVVGENRDVANIGSSTEYFRKVIQPHIHANIIEVLDNTGWNVFNVDVKQDEGVDLVADVTSPAFAVPYKDRFAITICTNLLEHVEDIPLVVKNLIAITRNGGHILITVPYKYKLHYDPIDNGFRPTPQEIINLFNEVAEYIIDSKIISINDIDQYRIKASRFPLWGYRERIAYYLGKRHKTSGVLFSINNKELSEA